MKKSLLLAFGLVMVATLSACGSKTNEVSDEWNVVVDNQENIVKENTPEKKTSLTQKDLETIEKEDKPASYSFQVYKGDADVSVDSWSYIYTTSNSETLIPESKDISSKKIISSSLEDGFIYTVSEVTFSDGSTGLVSYVNDPDSLKYLATVVQKWDDVVLYNFNY